MNKINGKTFLVIIVWLLVIGLLVYSRFINLGWGLPYPFHPDERNMAVAIQQLNWKDRLNPHFFAYGQFPLYLGYVISLLTKFDATISLRIISALASIINVIILVRIIKLFYPKLKFLNLVPPILILIFSPYAIQLAHFGTTESLLMLFYSLIVFYSLKIINGESTNNKYLWPVSLVSGLALATKMSSLLFLAIPVIAFILNIKNQKAKLHIKIQKLLIFCFIFAVSTLFFALIFSPYNFLNFPDFISSMRYESAVAFGTISVFYTRQFFNTIPIWFQLTKIFPYALGWPALVMGLIGLIRLMRLMRPMGLKDTRMNLIGFAILLYFIPNAFLYAKWTRFMAPILPILLLCAILFILKIKNKILFYLLILAMIFPGLAYLSVYRNPDVRFQATAWINKNIPENSYILSETANVVDVPLQSDKNYRVISFNFYELDNDETLQTELKQHIEKADYIFIPSRRIFTNLNNNYPKLNQYYDDLFNGKLGFKKVAEFSAGLNDEAAEETWTVFDHPVVRIYKKIKSF
jgi:hypothetical protein